MLITTSDSRYMGFCYPHFRIINILSMAMVDTATHAHWVACAVSPTFPTILTLGMTN
jgi:hypothetical protein